MKEGGNLPDLLKIAAGDGTQAEIVRAELQEKMCILTSYESFIWDAFWTISTTRPSSMSGLAPLSWREIADYIEYAEMTRSMGEKLMLEIMALDHHYVAAKNRDIATRSK